MKPIQFAKLSDICRIESGGTPSSSDPSYWDGNIPWVTLVDVRNKYVETTTRRISLSGLKNSSATVLPVGTVLFSSRATIGIVSIAKIELATNQGFKNFICDENKLIPEYLYYFLNYEAKRIEASCPGTTYKEISKSKIGKYTIPLPSFDDQKRIVNILDAADELRQKRRQAIGLLDDYLKSVFLDMFGDPIKNPKGWSTQQFKNLGTLDRGKSKHRPRNAPELLGGEHPLIQTGDVANADIYIEIYTSTYSDIGLKQSKKWPKGTLCITIAANIAKTGILSFDACFPDSVVGYIADTKKTNSQFIHFWMSFFQKILEANAPESAQKNINLQILRELEVINPPLDLQNKFSAIVGRSEFLKQKMLAQSEELDNQFQTLMQKAFKGNL